MKRHDQILAGVLVVQIILSIFVFRPKPAATGGNEPLFPDLEAGGIVALSIEDGDGNRIALRQVDGAWVLPDADDFPAQESKIAPLLDKILGLTTGRLVTRTEASHKQLQVAAEYFARRIDFETADGPALSLSNGTKETLYLGSSPSYGAAHFRVEGQNEVYLTNAISAWEASTAVASWIDTLYLSVPQADVTRVTLENEHGTFTFTKDDEDNWRLADLAAGETLNQTQVTTLLRQVTSINMVAPLGKEEQAAYGMDEPRAVVTIETGEKTITLHVGAKDPADDSAVVISSGGPYYVRVAGFSVQGLVENTREDFLQAPPAPTPEG